MRNAARPLRGVVVALAMIMITGGCGAVRKKSSAAPKPFGPTANTALPGGYVTTDDVTVIGCGVDPAAPNEGQAKLKVTNHTETRSAYVIRVGFESADGKTQIGTGVAAVFNGLEYGRSTTVTAELLQTFPPGTTCSVIDATRYAV